MTMRNMVFTDSNFLTEMRHTVEPYLKQYGQRRYMETEDGTRISCISYIPDNSEAVLVISHGFGEFAEKYNEMAYYFMKRGYEVWIPEHRGHGYSGRSLEDKQKIHIKDYTLYVEDMHNVIHKMLKSYEKPVYLLAHSMGGAIGAMYLEKYPDDFEAAVLSCPMLGIKMGRYPHLMAWTMSKVKCIVGKGDRYVPGQHGFSEKKDFEHSSATSRERYEYIFHKRIEDENYRTSGGTYSWTAASIEADRHIMKQKNIDNIKIPVLIFEAGRDHRVSGRAIRSFAKKNKHVTRVYYPEAKHEIFNDGMEIGRSYYSRVFRFFENQKNYRGI